MSYKTIPIMNSDLEVYCPNNEKADCTLSVRGTRVNFSITSKDYEILINLGFLQQESVDRASARITTGNISVID